MRSHNKNRCKKRQGSASFYQLLPHIGLICLFLSGCASYGERVKDGLNALESGDLNTAVQSMDEAFADKEDDRLLRHMELGLLKHLAKDYPASNHHLDQAEQIAADLYTQQISDLVATSLTNPRNGPYRGSDFEQVFIHYYKVLNDLQLAQLASPAAATDEVSDALTSARIESRKTDILLTALRNEQGSYQELKDKKEHLFSQLMEIFNQLSGGHQSTEGLIYREDAYLRYITGLIYELNGEYDNARIAYEQAAQLYENGYSKQYALGHKMAQQAWFDVARMMKKAGGYGNARQKIQTEKLTEAQQKTLDNRDKGGQLLVIQHLGMIPRREEMNLIGSIDADDKEFLIRLLPTGTDEHRQDQAAWFYAMYADHGLLDFIEHYAQGGLPGAIDGISRKELSLAPVWSLVDSTGLAQALQQGIRITVPYYPHYQPTFARSELFIDAHTPEPLLPAESLAGLAIQSQITAASDDMNEALARESIKNIILQQAVQKSGQGDNPLMGLAANLITAASSAAETRNWLTLPAAIRIGRIPLTSGPHEVTIRSYQADNINYYETKSHITIKDGAVYILSIRSFPETTVALQ